jgi:hypothetical protein
MPLVAVSPSTLAGKVALACLNGVAAGGFHPVEPLRDPAPRLPTRCDDSGQEGNDPLEGRLEAGAAGGERVRQPEPVDIVATGDELGGMLRPGRAELRSRDVETRGAHQRDPAGLTSVRSTGAAMRLRLVHPTDH